MAKFFSDEEIKNLSPDVVERLDKARDYCNFPIRMTCGYRTPERNAELGSKPDSAHVKGLAVDMQRPLGADEAIQLAWALGLAGFDRLEVCDKHLHVDMDRDKVHPLTWKGRSK